jgi:hypothetical protein
VYASVDIMTKEELSKIFTITIANARIVGKEKNQLRFDVILYVLGEVYAEIKGYRLMDGFIKPPQTRTGKGGFYTTFSCKNIEAICHRYFFNKRDSPGFRESISNVVLPEKETADPGNQGAFGGFFI